MPASTHIARSAWTEIPTLKRNWIVLGAHYNHRSTAAAIPMKGWKRFREAARAEIAMGDLHCFHIKYISIMITH